MPVPTSGLAKVLLYGGDFLPEQYGDWVALERQRLAQLYVEALKNLAAGLALSGKPESAIDYALRALRTDPYQEGICCDLMRYYVSTGQPTAALREYEHLRITLAQIGEMPSRFTQEQAQTILLQAQDRQSLSSESHVVITTQAFDKSLSAAPTSKKSEAGEDVASIRLPRTFTRFFGRQKEIAHLHSLLCPASHDLPLNEIKLGEQVSGLITLTGTGGSGKTRFAIEAVRQAANNFAGGVCFVPLADLSDARMIPGEIHKALRLPQSSHVPPTDQVVKALSGRRYLLLLDNFEHLTAAGAAIVQSLREHLPTLTCLITSRQRLELEGEIEFPLSPLSVPTSPDTLERLLKFDSVQMFVDRARTARPDFQLTLRNAAVVARICERLEGIPLAIELAAARAIILTPAKILEQLNQRFAFLESRKQGVPARHRSLMVAIDWSFRLLPEALQRFFAGLSIFRGGGTLEAAETICEEPHALEYLERLRQHTLILAEADEEEARFRLMETLREFGWERLDAEERNKLSEQHAAYFREMAENAVNQLRGPVQIQWLNRLEREQDNFRASLNWYHSHSASGQPEAYLQLATALYEFWFIRGYLREGWMYLKQALASTDAKHTLLRAKALLAAGHLSNGLGDNAAAIRLFEESLTIFQELREEKGIATALIRMGNAYCERGDSITGCKYCAEGLVLFRKLEDLVGTGTALLLYGSALYDIGDLQAAHKHIEEGLNLARASGDLHLISYLLTALGATMQAQGHPEQAAILFTENVQIARLLKDPKSIVYSLTGLAYAAVDLAQAYRGACLLGAVEKLREAIHFPIPLNGHALHTRYLSQIRASLAEPQFHQAWNQGKSMTEE